MGNRAAVVFTDGEHNISPTVYLQWNGGPESIYPFLDELQRRGYRGQLCYAAARFVHVVCDFLDDNIAGCLSVGIESGPTEITRSGLTAIVNMADDNGVYVVSPGEKDDWRVRRFILGLNMRGVVEMTKRQVATERTLAYKHLYNVTEDSIKERFLKMRPKISPCG